MTNDPGPPTFAEIRAAIAKTIADGLTVEIFEYAKVPDVNQVPALIVKPLSAQYLVNFGTDATYEFDLYVLVARQEAEVSQDLLDQFVDLAGENSIPAIIRANPTLGLDGLDVSITKMVGYGGAFENAKVPHMGAIFKCHVEADP